MDINLQKNKLLSELTEIEKDLNSFSREINNSGDWVIKVKNNKDDRMDPSDDANLTEGMEADIAVLNILEERHEQVKKALNVIENGSYGICDVCGEEISEERLTVNPSATKCIKHVA